MNGYLAILKTRTRALLRYRAAAVASIFTQLFWGVVMVMVFRAFYGSATTSDPISLNQAITFIWIGQALLRIIPWSLDKEIEAQIRNGNVAYELVRPLHLYVVWFIKCFAIRSTLPLIGCVPVFLIGFLFFGLSAPLSMEAGFVFCISLFLAILLSSSIMTLVLISLFWTISGEGIQRILPHITLFLSGMIVPLPLFPSWTKSFLNYQPFRGVMDIPCRLYTGVIPSKYALYYLGFQIAWTITFIGLGLLLMRKAIKNFVIQGG